MSQVSGYICSRVHTARHTRSDPFPQRVCWPAGDPYGAVGRGPRRFAAIVWLWRETDSYRPYSEKPLFSAAAMRLSCWSGRWVPVATGANLLMVWWEGFPCGNTGGAQMHRDVVAEPASDPANGIVMGNPMMPTATAAALPGTRPRASGGDNQHLGAPDNQRFAWLRR
jgi:hypothetical protein